MGRPASSVPHWEARKRRELGRIPAVFLARSIRFQEGASHESDRPRSVAALVSDGNRPGCS